MHPISAFIITKNEETRLSKAILSIKDLVDEIIVIDSGSTDGTVALAKSLGAKTIYNEWAGYVAQKSFGENLCKHKWILNIDADEELSKDLKAEIESIFASKQEDKFKAYRINFVIMHRKDSKPRFLAPSNRFIRLYRRDFASFGNSVGFTTRDAVTLNDVEKETQNVRILSGPAFHYSGVSIEQLVSKANFYSSEQAKDMLKNGRKPSKLRTYSEFFIHFFKSFFIRRYFVFGYHGFVDSLIFAFARFLRLSKARELFEQKKN
jgi:glycosyltransferase involved in cell wall biosynthesis